MSKDHQPRPEFVSQLEWQLRTSLKRGSRFSEPVRPYHGGKMKAVALIVVSALMGAGGVVVNDEMQEAKAKELLVAETEANIQLAALELDAMVERVEEVENRFRAGVIGEEEIMAARVALIEAEFHLATLQLDLEEIRASGETPKDQISTPLVGGRDFVTERLTLQESVAEAGFELTRIQFSRLQDLREAGLVGEEESAHLTLALQEAESQLERIQVRLDLRRQFLEEGMESGAAELELEILETEVQINYSERAMDDVLRRYRRMEDRVRTGVIHESELRQARVQIAEMEIELARLQRKLAILKGVGPSPDDR